MGLFERAEIRALSEKLLALAAGQGILLNSVAGRGLGDMLWRGGGGGAGGGGGGPPPPPRGGGGFW
ncbi:hypothetical protein ACLH0P_17880, partial [Aeromonas media]